VFSQDHQSVTILINGGEISRKDVQLSLEEGRPVVALSRTGRLADEISRDFDRNGLITVVSANAEERITEILHNILRIGRTNETP
jgi:flagellar motor component MotA